MEKYRKKPVEIEAFQFEGDFISNGKWCVPDWAVEAYHKNVMYFEGPELYIKTLEGVHHVSFMDYVIRGVNGELYPCKPDIFKKTYDEVSHCIDNMTFGLAIEAMKQGKRVQRKGWNGKSQYIELATNVSYKNPSGVIQNVDHEQMGNKAIAFVGTSGVQLGWLASQADMLSEDWQIVDEA